MTWFKVDDTFAFHAKVIAAGNAAVGLWARAGAWSMQQLTDGHIPTHVAQMLGTRGEARRLVDAGLWVQVDDGYKFHQWTDVQRTKEQVKADRDAATDRQRRAREAAKSRRDAQRDSGVSHGPPDQTRPDQTSSSYGTNTTADAVVGAGKPAATKRAHQLPADFVPNDTNRRIAAERGLDLRAVFEQFADHHRAKGTTMKDWHLALNTWLRKERSQALAAKPSSNMQNHLALVAQLAAEEEEASLPFGQLGGAS